MNGVILQSLDLALYLKTELQSDSKTSNSKMRFEVLSLSLHPNNTNSEAGFSLSRSQKPLIRDLREYKPAPNKKTMPSGEPWKEPFSFLSHSIFKQPPVTCLKVPYWSASLSHIPSH
jgi:hypothetical protein